MNTDKITHIELTDNLGRTYSHQNCVVTAVVSDKGKTLKLLITQRPTRSELARKAAEARWDNEM